MLFLTPNQQRESTEGSDDGTPYNNRVTGVTGQLADTPTHGLPTRGLDISQTGQLAD